MGDMECSLHFDAAESIYFVVIGQDYSLGGGADRRV